MSGITLLGMGSELTNPWDKEHEWHNISGYGLKSYQTHGTPWLRRHQSLHGVYANSDFLSLSSHGHIQGGCKGVQPPMGVMQNKSNQPVFELICKYSVYNLKLAVVSA